MPAYKNMFTRSQKISPGRWLQVVFGTRENLLIGLNRTKLSYMIIYKIIIIELNDKQHILFYVSVKHWQLEIY